MVESNSIEYNMTKEQLIQRRQDIEWDNFEIKTAKADIPKDVWETVSAFSNISAGGWILMFRCIIIDETARVRFASSRVLTVCKAFGGKLCTPLHCVDDRKDNSFFYSISIAF
jgi:hypothetical protein